MTTTTYISSVEAIVSAVISSGTSLSEAVNIASIFKSDVRAAGLFGLIMPAAWDAAALTVLGSFDGGATFIPMKSLYDGTEITYVVRENAYFPLPNIAIMAGVTHLKLQSGTTDAPVVQSAARTIQLVLRSI